MAKMSTLSGIPPAELDMYHIWEIADHIMVTKYINIFMNSNSFWPFVIRNGQDFLFILNH
jgi:hypothetical protein